MANRRSFIAGMLAAGLLPGPTWAEAGNPSFLSAGMKPDGTYVLCGLTGDGHIVFELPLPARGHAAAAHPTRAEAVGFARRPGTFAIILDCLSGRETARLHTPNGRHFYGHGAFSVDGALLFTTENDIQSARGVIGVWDVASGYQRIDEFPSGGTGPHEIRLMPDGRSLVVANGGIETHPDAGRTKLNIPTMRPNLSYLGPDGRTQEVVELEPALHRNSIRHLAVAPNGAVAFAMQWQGDLTEDVPLLAVHDRSAGTLQLARDASVRRMTGYLGSVAISADGQTIVATSPRQSRYQVFRRSDLTLQDERTLNDVCGVAAAPSGFLVTTGGGLVAPLSGAPATHPVHWDNHLVAL